jgi:hypothetical protein
MGRGIDECLAERRVGQKQNTNHIVLLKTENLH